MQGTGSALTGFDCLTPGDCFFWKRPGGFSANGGVKFRKFQDWLNGRVPFLVEYS